MSSYKLIVWCVRLKLIHLEKKNRIGKIADGFWKVRVVLDDSVDRNDLQKSMFLWHNLKYHQKPYFWHFEIRISRKSDLLEQLCGRIWIEWEKMYNKMKCFIQVAKNKSNFLKLCNQPFIIEFTAWACITKVGA